MPNRPAKSENETIAKRGRRPAGKRATFRFRLTDELRDKLSAAALTAGRPVSEEIEQRLEQSFLVTEALYKLFGSSTPATYELIKSLSESLKRIRAFAERHNYGEERTRLAMRAAIERLVEIYFWDGSGDSSLGPSGVASKPPVHTSRRPPKETGWEVAEWAMFWNGDMMRDEFDGGRLSNIWSGDGTKSRQVREPLSPPDDPLEGMLLGDNRPTALEPGNGLEFGEEGGVIPKKVT
jgi:hypothetical protein